LFSSFAGGVNVLEGGAAMRCVELSVARPRFLFARKKRSLK